MRIKEVGMKKLASRNREIGGSEIWGELGGLTVVCGGITDTLMFDNKFAEWLNNMLKSSF